MVTLDVYANINGGKVSGLKVAGDCTLEQMALIAKAMLDEATPKKKVKSAPATEKEAESVEETEE